MKGNCGECNLRWACDIDPDKCNAWPDPVPMTNADRIRAMSDEEIAESSAFRFCPSKMTGESCTFRNCKECWLEWLRQPAEEDKHETD